jgi:hypothetical protein
LPVSRGRPQQSAFLWVASIITWSLANFKRAKRFAVNVLTPREFLNQLENPT